jgi:hypothetical protein
LGACELQQLLGQELWLLDCWHRWSGCSAWLLVYEWSRLMLVLLQRHNLPGNRCHCHSRLISFDAVQAEEQAEEQAREHEAQEEEEEEEQGPEEAAG